MGIEIARKRRVKVGFLRLVTAWPFPEKRVRELARKVKAFVVPEINLGQMVLEVERCAGGKADAVLVPHAGGGVHDPEAIADAIVRAAR
jgi:2-oxoglutarate ferredoxin oxidoreductase subunit alpha